MKVEEDEDTRRKKRVFPQALVGLQASPNVYFELQNVQDEFPSRKQEDKGPTCHINKSGARRKPSTATRDLERRREVLRGVRRSLRIARQ